MKRRPVIPIPAIRYRVYFRAPNRSVRGLPYVDISAAELRVYRSRAGVVRIEALKVVST